MLGGDIVTIRRQIMGKCNVEFLVKHCGVVEKNMRLLIISTFNTWLVCGALCFYCSCVESSGFLISIAGVLIGPGPCYTSSYMSLTNHAIVICTCRH